MVAALVVAAVVMASLAAGQVSAAVVGVEGGNNYFCSEAFDGSPCTTNVNEGDTVTWTMVAGTHTVTLCSEGFSQCPPAGGWDSGLLGPGETFSQVFTAPGTFPYRCELHPSDMLGYIHVLQPTFVVTATPAITAGPTSAPIGSTSATAVALPQTGSAPGSGADATLHVALGLLLLTSSAGAFVLAKRRA